MILPLKPLPVSTSWAIEAVANCVPAAWNVVFGLLPSPRLDTLMLAVATTFPFASRPVSVIVGLRPEPDSAEVDAVQREGAGIVGDMDRRRVDLRVRSQVVLGTDLRPRVGDREGTLGERAGQSVFQVVEAVSRGDRHHRRNGGAVGAEAHGCRERARDRGGGDAVVVAGAVEVTRAGGREGQRPFVDAAGRDGAADDRHIVGDIDLEVARGQCDAAAVVVDRLDEARQVERGRALALVRPIVERIDQRERVGAVAVEREGEDLVPAIGRATIGPGGERLRVAVGAVAQRRQGDVVDLLAVRGDAEVMRRAAGDREREAGRVGPIERGAVGAERHGAGDRAAEDRRGAGSLVVAAAVEIAQRAGGERAFLHAA